MNTDTPTPTPQPEQTTVKRRRRHPVDRDRYFIDWSQYRSIWHFPNKWIAEALGYSVTGVAAARRREAPEDFKEEPTDLKTCLRVAYPLVEGVRWTEEDILNLLNKVHDLEVQVATANLSIQGMKKTMLEIGVGIPEVPKPKPQPKVWNLLRWILGGGLAAASVGILIALLTGGAK